VIKSTHKKYKQSQLNKIFAAQLGNYIDQNLRYKIWYNPTDDASLRLSLEGLRFVTQNLKLQYYEFELDSPLKNKNLVQLERYFSSMYYIMPKKIIVFDEDEATMLSLHSSDLPTYLDSLEKNL
jgi:hypothetical protein